MNPFLPPGAQLYAHYRRRSAQSGNHPMPGDENGEPSQAGPLAGPPRIYKKSQRAQSAGAREGCLIMTLAVLASIVLIIILSGIH